MGSLGPRVCLLVGGTQALGRDMGINLGGAKRCVPEEFLNTAQICPTIQKMSGSRVTESVRTDGPAARILRQQRRDHLIDASRPQVFPG